MISLSLYPIAFGTIGGNVLRDILSIDGDSKVGYPTLPQKIGSINSAKMAAVFFTLTGVLAPLPYFIGKFTIALFAVYFAMECSSNLLFNSPCNFSFNSAECAEI